MAAPGSLWVLACRVELRQADRRHKEYVGCTFAAPKSAARVNPATSKSAN